MGHLSKPLVTFAVFAGVIILAGPLPSPAQKRTLAGVACTSPQAAGGQTAGQGSAVEPKTGRSFFLDYPCDLKNNERVVFILSLHGAGASGNWQRRYFPAVDYVHKYR